MLTLFLQYLFLSPKRAQNTVFVENGKTILRHSKHVLPEIPNEDIVPLIKTNYVYKRVDQQINNTCTQYAFRNAFIAIGYT